jgi:hypothetical protein
MSRTHRGFKNMQRYMVVLFLGGMSIILGVVAYIIYESQQNIVRNGDTATGTVVDMNYDHSGKRGGVYYPIVKFETAGGEVVEGRGQMGSSPPSYKVGDTVKVLYLKNDPKSWVIDRWPELYFLSAVIGLFASILGIVSIVATLRLMRNRPGKIAPSYRKK